MRELDSSSEFWESPLIAGPLAMPKNTDPRVADAIADYFSSRTQGPWSISTAQAMRRIRETAPGSAISDDDLVRMIADYAIARGLTVTFDAGESRG